MTYKVRQVYDFFRYDIHQGIASLIYFFRVIFRFRRWDYTFQLDVIQRMLENCDHHWRKSHYLGKDFTHLRIKVLLRMLARYRNYWDSKGPSSFKEEHRLLQRFLRAYIRTLPHLWD